MADKAAVDTSIDTLLESIDALKGEVTNYKETGYKAAGRRSRSTLTKVTKAGKVFRALSLEVDKNKE